MNTIKSINWLITNKCNSQCIHCDIWQNKDKKELSIQKVAKILNDKIINRSYKQSGIDISLAGGEPFLRDDIQKIIGLIERKYPGSFNAISTNGLLTRKILNFIRKNQSLNFKINISVDGLEKTHDEIRGKGFFKKTVRTISFIKKYFPMQEVEIKFTLIPENFDQILRVYALASKLGVGFSFKPAESMECYTNQLKSINLDFTQEQLCEIRNQTFKLADLMYEEGRYAKARFYRDIPFYLAKKKIPKSCSVLNTHLTIMPNGDSYFCIKEKKIGNLIKNPLVIPKYKKGFECKSCMLMCGAFKDYSNEYFDRKTANVETTVNCNLDCKICTQKELREKPLSDMSMSVFEKIILENVDINHISFVGGEPFLNKNFFKMMGFLDTKGLTYEITTNGTVINENVVNELCKCIGLKRINFSLDGLRKYHDKARGPGVFDRCIDSLKLCVGLFDVNVCTVLMNDNVNEIPKLTKYLAVLGVKSQKIIYGMNILEKERISSQKQFPKLKIQGPVLRKQIKDHKRIKDLFSSLGKISKKNKIKVTYEPEIFGNNIKSFLEGSVDNFSCKQLDQLRFDGAGRRIVCEFIRNRSCSVDIDSLRKNLLPICKKCCKLENKTFNPKNRRSTHNYKNNYNSSPGINDILDIAKNDFLISIKKLNIIKEELDGAHFIKAIYSIADYQDNKYMLKVCNCKRRNNIKNFISIHNFLIKKRIVLNEIILSKNRKQSVKKGNYEYLLLRLADHARPININKSEIVKVGQFLGNYHNMMDEFNRKEGFKKDGKPLRLRDALRMRNPGFDDVHINFPGLIQIFKETLDKINSFDNYDFTVVHGDFHKGNILRNKEGLLIVDYEEISVKPRLFDVAHFIFETTYRNRHNDQSLEFFEIMSNFLKGYRKTSVKKIDKKKIDMILPICVYFCIEGIFYDLSNNKGRLKVDLDALKDLTRL